MVLCPDEGAVRLREEGLCGAGGRSAGVAGALETLLLASEKVLQQQPPNGRHWTLRAGWSTSNKKKKKCLGGVFRLQLRGPQIPKKKKKTKNKHPKNYKL